MQVTPSQQQPLRTRRGRMRRAVLKLAVLSTYWSHTLNNNNITLIPLSSFNHMPKLRTLRLHSNNLHCDCHLSWLSDWLRARRGLAPFTQCMAPAHMRGLNVPDVQKKDF
ncbi:unnamed protein product, partial [Pleuronectes platessa]